MSKNNAQNSCALLAYTAFSFFRQMIKHPRLNINQLQLRHGCWKALLAGRMKCLSPFSDLEFQGWQGDLFLLIKQNTNGKGLKIDLPIKLNDSEQ